MAYNPAAVPQQISQVLAEYLARELRRIGVELKGLAATVDGINTTISGSATLALGNTFITVTDETAQLANSRRLVAGANCSLNYSTSHQVIINVATPTIPPDIQSLTFITTGDETAAAPNSKRLIAGTGIELSVSATVRISSTGGGSGLSIGEVLSTLDSAEEFREEVIVNYWPGIVGNSASLSMSSAVRVANGLAFQDCIDFCVGKRKRLRMVWDTIQIELPGGLEIRSVWVDDTTGEVLSLSAVGSTPVHPTGFTWIAPLTAEIHQYATNTPVLTIVPVDNPSAIFGIDFYGCTLHYGQDESANTSSNALVLGPLWLCRIGGIRVASTTTTNKNYRACFQPQSEFFFSNHLYDMKLFKSSQSLMELQSTGTGNLFDNIYLSGVSSSGVAASVASPFKYSHPSAGQFHGNVFNQFNIEWCQANKLIDVQNARGITFNGVHLEQNRLSGNNACLVNVAIADVTFNGLMALDNRYETGTVSGTAPSWFSSFNDSGITVQNMGYRINSSGYMNTNVFMFHQNGGITNTPARIHIDNLRLQDTGSALRRFLKVDSDDMDTAFGELALLNVGEVHIGEPSSRLERAEYSIAASTVVYGAMSDEAFIRGPASLTSTLHVQLSRYMGPPGSRGDLIPVKRGAMATVRRSAGTTVNSFVIENQEEGTRILSSLTAATSVRLYFDGARWTTASRGEPAVLRYASTVADYDDTLMVNAGGGTQDISLPALSLCLGRKLTIKKIDDSSNVVVIDGSGAETIDGLSTHTLSAQYQFLTIIGGASDWHIIGR